MHETSLCMCMVGPDACAHGKDMCVRVAILRACAWPYYAQCMRVATNRAGILLAIMRPAQLKINLFSSGKVPENTRCVMRTSIFLLFYDIVVLILWQS